jgi:hypothetical protein
MSIRSFLIIILAIFVVSSCRDSRSPCEMDSFFCSAPNTWANQANSLPTSRVYALHRAGRYWFKPPSSIFIHVLGARGEEVVPLLLRSMRSNIEDRDALYFIPVLQSVKEESGFDACQSVYREDIERVISSPDVPSVRRSENISAFRSFCQT